MNKILALAFAVLIAFSGQLCAQTTLKLDDFESGMRVMNPADPLPENSNLWAQYPGCKLSGAQCGGIATIVGSIFHSGAHSMNDHIISAGFTANGSGATFNVTNSSPTYSVTLNQAGSGYAVGEMLNIRGDALGGARLTNDVTITVSVVNGSGDITSFLSSGVAVGSASYSGVAAYAYLPQSYFQFSPESDSGSTGFSAPSNGWGLMHNFTGGGSGNAGTPNPAWTTNYYNRMQMWVKIPQQNQLGLASNDSSGLFNAPQNLQLSRTNNGTQMNVTWSAPSIGTPTSYTITRCTGAGCTLTVPDLTHAVSGSTLSYNDTGLNPNTNYSYQIAAADSASHSSFNQILEQQGILQFGTYVRPQYCADPDPPDPVGDPDCVNTSAVWDSTSDNGAELGGGHWYHFFAVPATTEWYQLVLDTHPSHFRGGPGAQEWGDQTYPTVAQSNYIFPSQGSSATFNVTESGSNYVVTINAAGSGYSVNSKIVLLGTSVGGTSPTNDVFITVSSVNGGGGVTGITSLGASTGSSSQTGVAPLSNECYEPPIVGSTVLPLSSQLCANTVSRDTTWNYFDAMTRFYLDFYNDGYTLTSSPADYYFDDIELYRDPNTANNINVDQVYSLGGVWVPSSNRIHVGWQHPKDDAATCHDVAYAFVDVFSIGFNSATLAPNGHICPQAGPYAGMVYDTSAIDKTGQSVIYIAIRPVGATTFNEIAIPLASDTTLPSAPTNLSPTVTGDVQVSLSWTAATDNIGVAGYSIERCSGASCSNFVAVGTVSGTTYTDTGLTVSTAYSYRVRAIDTSFNYGPYSTVLSLTTTADNAPTAPTNLNAAAASGAAGAGEIVLTWTAATDDVAVTGYSIERCAGTSCSSFAQVGTTTVATSYSDFGLTPIQNYSYRIRAMNASTNLANNLGPYSNTASASTAADTSAPSVLNGLTATVASSSEIDLSWGRLQSAVVRYYINEATSGTTPTQLIDTGGVGTPENLSINYGSGNMAYAGSGFQHGLTSTSLTGTQGASVTLTGSDKVVTQLTGMNQATMEFVIQATGFSPTDTSIFGITSASLPSFFVRVNSSNTWQLFWRGTFVAQWTASASTRSVFDIVVDTTQAVEANRVVVYQNGASIPITELTGTLAQNTSSAVDSFLGNIDLMNSNFGSNTDRSPQGTLYYAAIYNTALSSSEVTANYQALTVDDDTVGATDNVGVTGYDIVRCAGTCTPSVGSNLVTTVSGSTLSYSDTGLSSSTTYTYSVNAFDAGANVAANSNLANATTNGGGPVTATSTILSVNNATVTYGTSETFTATVMALGNPVTTGTVTFKDTVTSATLASNVALNGSGVATAMVVVSAGAGKNIQATYNCNLGCSGFGTSSGLQSVTVNAATLSITANNDSKTYGQTRTYGAGSAAFTSSGLVNSETITSITTASTGASATAAVGTYNLVPSAATGSGFTASNYNITYNNGTLTVNAAPLTVTASNDSKAYGQTRTYGAGSTAFTSSALQNSETIATVTITASGGAAATAAVGTDNLTPSAATGGTFTASNYNITYNNGTLTVNAAPLTVTANNDSKTYGQTKTYGAGLTAFTSSALQNSETIGTVTITASGGAAATAAVGTDNLTPSAATGGTFTASNYNITYSNGTLTVNAAPLTVTANNDSKTYGQARTYGAGLTAFTSSALQNSETIGTVTITASGGAAATGAVGTDNLTPSAAMGGTFTASNYNITYSNGTLTVNAAPLTVTANNDSKTYGQTKTYGAGLTAFTSSALQNSETIGTVTITASGGAAATGALGTYNLTPSAATGGTFTASNYNITYGNGTLTVNTAPLTITAANDSKTYGQTKTYGAGSTAYTPIGLQNSETIGTVTIAASGGTAATGALGTYNLTPSAATGGTFTASNYSITYSNGTLTVNAAPLTITAANDSKTYGQTKTYGSGSAAYTSVGLQNSETIGTVTITASGGAAAAGAVGAYNLTPSAATGGTFTASNYSITYSNGALTVSKAPLTVTANNQTLTYGSIAYTATFGGFVNGDTSAVISGAPAYTTNATLTNGQPNVGSWTLTPSLGTLSATNYTFTTFTPGSLTMSPAVLTVTAVNLRITVGASPGFSTTINGFVNGDSSSVVSGSAILSTNATLANGVPTVGSWTITPALGTLSASNYTFVFVNGTLAVVAASGTTAPFPTVSITSPADGSTVAGSVTVSATASSSIGIASVQIQLDGTGLGSFLTGAPYSVVWDTTTSANGTHALTAVAQDTSGQMSSSTVVVTVSNKAPTTSITVQSGGGESFTTTDSDSSEITVNHGELQNFAGASSQMATPLRPESLVTVRDTGTGNTLTGIAVVGLRQNGVLVTEAGIPASRQIASGRIYAELLSTVSTGVAMSNETTTDATISFYFTDASGKDSNTGSFTLRAGNQLSAFLNQAPFNGPTSIEGTFTFTSSVPVGVIALRTIYNERGEFLIANLPVATLDSISGVAILPHFADGGGWTTKVALVNNSEASMAGTLQFMSPGAAGQSGKPLTLSVNGSSASSFSYSIPAHGVQTFVTAGSAANTQVGSVQIVPSSGPFSSNGTPSAAAIFSFRDGSGVTVTEAGVLATPADTGFRVYVQESGPSAPSGIVQTGIAIANPSSAPVVVNVSLNKLDGTSLGLSQSINVPAGGQIAEFFDQIFAQLGQQGSSGLQAVAHIVSPTPIAVTALRGRYNERGDFLVSTTPPLDETTPATNLVFPQIVSGMGYNTQIVIFGTGGSGNFYLLSPTGTVLPGSSLSPQ